MFILFLGKRAEVLTHLQGVLAMRPDWRCEFLDSGPETFWDEPLPARLLLRPPDLAVALSEYKTSHRQWLRAFNARGVPTLLVMHGLIEWRAHVEHLLPTAPLRPAVSSAIACMGPAQERILRAWGNAQPIVVTGHPRFDGVRALREARRSPDRFSVLVATANRFHSESQRIAVGDGLHDLTEYFRKHPDIRVVWRVNSSARAFLPPDLGRRSDPRRWPY